MSYPSSYTKRKSRPLPFRGVTRGGGVPSLRIKIHKTKKLYRQVFHYLYVESCHTPLLFQNPPTLRGVPTFLRKSYHTDYIDVVPPQKNHKKKKTANFAIYCMYLPPPPSDAPEGTEKNPSSSPYRPPSGAMIILDK